MFELMICKGDPDWRLRPTFSKWPRKTCETAAITTERFQPNTEAAHAKIAYLATGAKAQ